MGRVDFSSIRYLLRGLIHIRPQELGLYVGRPQVVVRQLSVTLYAVPSLAPFFLSSVVRPGHRR